VGGIVLVTITFTVVPEIRRADPAKGEGLQNGRQWLEFLCFPVLAVLGLALAYWLPGVGGAVSLAGMPLFFLLRPNLWSDPFMLAMWIPGSLYVAYAVLAGYLAAH
jgi:hypothetical protein